MLDFFRLCNKYAKRRSCPSPLVWARRYGLECQTLGIGYVGHGIADYRIGSFSDKGDPIIKARGHQLNATHYNPETGAETVPAIMPLIF